jgi:hypothetical protein
MKAALVVASFALVGGCISKAQRVSGDHLIANTGTVSLEGIKSVQFKTKDGFEVSAMYGIGELTISETQVCGLLNLYHASVDAPRPSWAPPSDEYQRFQSIECIDRNNIASTTMTVRQTDPVASATCIALLPLCIIGHGVPGQ